MPPFSECFNYSVSFFFNGWMLSFDWSQSPWEKCYWPTPLIESSTYGDVWCIRFYNERYTRLYDAYSGTFEVAFEVVEGEYRFFWQWKNAIANDRIDFVWKLRNPLRIIWEEANGSLLRFEVMGWQHTSERFQTTCVRPDHTMWNFISKQLDRMWANNAFSFIECYVVLPGS